jgi:glycosyltransferase involved in cell wall biosynthesis
MIKISIVTPSFNSAKFIEDCIQSVLNQNYPNFEHIIVDGCSTDGTVEILKKYPHLKWISEPDEGQSDALNKGFKMATGEIIGWLNADEIYLPNIFQNIANYFDLNKYDVIYGDYYLKYHDEDSKLKISAPFIKKAILFKQFINTNLFFAKSIISENILIDTSLHYCMDKDWVYRLELSGKTFKYLNMPFVEIRYDSNAKSVKYRYKQILESKNLILKYYFKNNTLAFNLFFWPVKFYYDIRWKINVLIHK